VLPLRQRSQLFRNSSGGRFEEVRPAAGEALALERVSRGAAFGDLDNDGDTDIVVVNNSAPAWLLRNEVGASSGWIGFRVLEGERDALGASVTLEVDGRSPLRRWVKTDGSFLSSNDPRVLFGLAGAKRPTTLVVRWLDGHEERWPAPMPGRYWLVRRGQAPVPIEAGRESSAP
jgi:enediyne biosynthesis protein E4